MGAGQSISTSTLWGMDYARAARHWAATRPWRNEVETVVPLGTRRQRMLTLRPGPEGSFVARLYALDIIQWWPDGRVGVRTHGTNSTRAVIGALLPAWRLPTDTWVVPPRADGQPGAVAYDPAGQCVWVPGVGAEASCVYPSTGARIDWVVVRQWCRARDRTLLTDWRAAAGAMNAIVTRETWVQDMAGLRTSAAYHRGQMEEAVEAVWARRWQDVPPNLRHPQLPLLRPLWQGVGAVHITARGVLAPLLRRWLAGPGRVARQWPVMEQTRVDRVAVWSGHWPDDTVPQHTGGTP